MSHSAPTWETTKISNLLRNTANGKYYGRFTLAGKQNWVNLKTNVWTIAKLRVADERTRFERLRASGNNVITGMAKMSDLAALYLCRVGARVELKPNTRQRLREEVETIAKTWPDFAALSPRNLTRDAVMEWRNRVHRDGTGFIVPGGRKTSAKINGSSPSLINKCIDALRRMLDIAVEQGQLGSNVLSTKGLKLQDTPRKPNLPEASRLSEIFGHVERSGGRFSKDAADFCRFLAYTGCRLGEARAIVWSDVDLTMGILQVRGTKTKAANRELPLVPVARALLEKLRAERKVELADLPGAPLSGKVLRVGEAGKSLANACRKVGVEPLTHHDLRDAFATLALEAGVDIPTIASWLGHADGGALLMKVYAHHRRAHGLRQAANVTFHDGVDIEPVKVGVLK